MSSAVNMFGDKKSLSSCVACTISCSSGSLEGVTPHALLTSPSHSMGSNLRLLDSLEWRILSKTIIANFPFRCLSPPRIMLYVCSNTICFSLFLPTIILITPGTEEMPIKVYAWLLSDFIAKWVDLFNVDSSDFPIICMEYESLFFIFPPSHFRILAPNLSVVYPSANAMFQMICEGVCSASFFGIFFTFHIIWKPPNSIVESFDAS